MPHPKPRAGAQPPASNHSRWASRVALFVLPLVFAALWSSHQIAQNGELGYPMDDPYIHFQYAKNLATGHGFSFNPGEPSPGATSPLWVVVLALGRLLGMPLEAWRIARREGPAGAMRDLAILTGAFVAMLVPYTAFCLATTGRPLPNTFYAKSWLPSIADTLFATLRAKYLPLMHNVAWHDNLTFAVLLVPGVIVWIVRHLKRGSGLVVLWPLAFMAYSLVFYPRHFSLSRYTMPLVPFLALLSMAPLAWVMQWLRSPAQRAAAIAVVAVAVGFGGWRSSTDYEPIYLSNCDNILRQQVAAGRWVAKNLPPGARVATNDVGAITWFGGHYCIDVVGLVSSDFITHMQTWWKRYHTAFAEEALPSFLRVAKPDYCILFPAWYPNLTREPWLTAIGQFQYPNNTGGGNELVVYRISGVPTGPMERRAGAP